MELQTTIYGCGAAALTNAIRALGYDVPQDAVAELAHTTGEGTGARELQRAAKRMGCGVALISTGHARAAYHQLLGAIAMGDSAVLLVDGMEHWVTALGVHGAGRVVVVDPAASIRPMLNIWDEGQLDAAWDCGGNRSHYAILVRRKP